MKKYLFIPIAFLSLALLFMLISFFVYITRGRASLVKKKLCIGALLLGISGFSLGGCSVTHRPTCYKPAMDPGLVILKDKIAWDMTAATRLNLSVQNSFKGLIRRNVYDWLSFCLHKDKKIIQKGNLLRPDRDKKMIGSGMFDIKLNKNTPPGKYLLSLYVIPAEKINGKNVFSSIRSYRIEVVKE